MNRAQSCLSLAGLNVWVSALIWGLWYGQDKECFNIMYVVPAETTLQAGLRKLRKRRF